MLKILSVSVENSFGVLTRISNIFSNRAFNINSVSIGTTENKNISKIILVIEINPETMSQIVKQLKKLPQVLEVKDITDSLSIERELMLVKIACSLKENSEIIKLLSLANICNAKIATFSDSTITLEIIGTTLELLRAQELLKHYHIVEIVRTGKIAIE